MALDEAKPEPQLLGARGPRFRGRSTGSSSLSGGMSRRMSGGFFRRRSRSCIAIANVRDRNAHLLAQCALELVADVGMFLQEQAGIVAPLAQTLAAEGNPRAGFFQDPLIDAKIDQIALARN